MAALGALCVTSCLEKKAELVGKVVDAFHQPLPEVTVTIAGSSFSSTTDSDGTYSIPYVPGNFSVIYSRSGYTLFQRDLSIATKETYPLDDSVLVRLPSKPGIAFFNDRRFVELKPASISVKQQASQGFSFNQNLYLSSFFAQGDYVQVNYSEPAPVFVDNDGADQRLFKVSANGLFLTRGTNFGSTNDQAAILPETEGEVNAGVFLRQSASPLQPGMYAFVTVPQSFGSAGLGSGIATIGGGPPVTEPIFLFEVVPTGVAAADSLTFDPFANEVASRISNAKRCLEGKQWPLAFADAAEVLKLKPESKEATEIMLDALREFDDATPDRYNLEQQAVQFARQIPILQSGIQEIIRQREEVQVAAERALHDKNVKVLDDGMSLVRRFFSEGAIVKAYYSPAYKKNESQPFQVTITGEIQFTPCEPSQWRSSPYDHEFTVSGRMEWLGDKDFGHPFTNSSADYDTMDNRGGFFGKIVLGGVDSELPKIFVHFGAYDTTHGEITIRADYSEWNGKEFDVPKGYITDPHRFYRTGFVE